MSRTPRLSVGIPVYNGHNYLADSIESLLGQSYEDFELIISDNASTDDTADICRRYEKQDSRIRYFRQERNIGGAPNHNFLVEQARGELFKWASDDDLYARDLLKLCVDALDEFPDVVLAHSWTAVIDASGTVTQAVRYGLATASPSAPERFRSLLYEVGGDDDGGVIRMDVLRRAPLLGSYHHSDRTLHRRVCPVRPLLSGAGLAVLPPGSCRTGRAGVQDRSALVCQPGPAPVRCAPESGDPPVRRICLGLRQRDPGGSADTSREARLLPAPGWLAGQPGQHQTRPVRARATVRR